MFPILGDPVSTKVEIEIQFPKAAEISRCLA